MSALPHPEGWRRPMARHPSPGAFARPGCKYSLSTSAGYSAAISTGVRDITPPEICDAIRNAAITAGTLINLRN